jgi:hypothetical protein
MGRFHDYLVSAEGAHLVIHPFGQAAGFSLNAVKGIGMRKNADLPLAFGRKSQNGGLSFDDATIERAGLGGIVQMFALSQDYPTLCDWISSDFHAKFSAGGAPNEKGDLQFCMTDDLDHAE